MSVLTITAVVSWMSLPTLASIGGAARQIVRRPLANWLIAGAVLLASSGVLLLFSGSVERRVAIAYAAPLAQLGLIHALFKLFVRTQGREPVDTFLNFKRGLLPDRIFAVSVGLGGILPFIPWMGPNP